jgi:segregation and condensation protein A
MSYAVRTPVFEGPFDLLLHLILKQEVELWEVSLSEIVDAYISELDRMDTLDLDVATEFLLIAATLVELKARRLLPGIEDLELDEELLRFEERDLLLARLLECKTFKDAARRIPASSARADRSVARRAGPEEPYRPSGSSRHRKSSSSTPSTWRRCAPASATRWSPCCASFLSPSP